MGVGWFYLFSVVRVVEVVVVVGGGGDGDNGGK